MLARATHIVIPDQIRRMLWAYIDSNQDEVVLSLYHGFVRVKLGQLRPVFVALLGDDPTL